MRLRNMNTAKYVFRFGNDARWVVDFVCSPPVVSVGLFYGFSVCVQLMIAGIGVGFVVVYGPWYDALEVGAMKAKSVVVLG